MKRTLVGVASGGLTLFVGFLGYDAISTKRSSHSQMIASGNILSRDEQIDRLERQHFDLLIIGGGASGVSCALDATTRGMNVALIERGDFSSGTSSRSTKMLHGGVRYLEKAFMQFDKEQFSLVLEALRERDTLLQMAPYLAQPFGIMTPCYKMWEVPYYWAGLKVYDLIAGSRGLTLSRFVRPSECKQVFPTIAAVDIDGSSLKGAVMYFDGQFNDSRLCIAIALSAATFGATVCNHTEVLKLVKDNTGSAIGAQVRDCRSGSVFSVSAKKIVNCTGPYSDSMRDSTPIVRPSKGVHITLPEYYSPENTGMVVPRTKDGRVVFMLHWLGKTIAGTTDTPCSIDGVPTATEDDTQFILDAIDPYLQVKARRSDVLSVWAGIRPLVADPNAGSTQAISREHIIHQEEDGVVTLAGGKWTTCRLMAEQTIDLLFPGTECITKRIRLIGTDNWSPSTVSEVSQNYSVPHRTGAIDTKVAKYLSAAYGSNAFKVTKLAEDMKLGRRLVYGHPILEAEVVYCARYEYSETLIDFIAYRTRLAFLDVLAAKQALPRVAELMAIERGWTLSQKELELATAMKFLETFESK